MSTQQPEALQCATDLEYSIPRHRIQDTFILNAYKALRMVRAQHARITELESQLAQRFDAADMATAAAQGFRDGVASVSAGSEPVAVVGSDFTLYWAGTGPIAPIVEKHGIKVGSPLYSHPSPTEGMVMAPKVPTVEMKAAAVKYANGTAVYKNVKAEVLRIEEDIYGEVYEAMIAAATRPC